MDDDDKNDYELINNLFADNSEQSLLKLKMIVDYDDIDIDKIDKGNFTNFVKLFKDNFARDIFQDQFYLLVGCIPKDYVIEFIESFKNDFEKLFVDHTYVIKNFHEDNIIEIILMFKDIFNEWFYDYSSVQYIHESKRYEVFKLFPQFHWDHER